MSDNYEKIVQQNLQRLYADLPPDLAKRLPAEQEGEEFIFNAFGQSCRLGPERISFDSGRYFSVLGILVSLYALHARREECVLSPWKAYRQFPDSMPYAAAFAANTEQPLVPYVTQIKENRSVIKERLQSKEAPADMAGDFSFLLYPLPKIALCYIFYEADEDFPAAVTCLYSSNADLFLPVDALADTGEYTSRKILELLD